MNTVIKAICHYVAMWAKSFNEKTSDYNVYSQTDIYKVVMKRSQSYGLKEVLFLGRYKFFLDTPNLLR